MWYPRRMLKSVSRRIHLAGDGDSATAVEFIERTGLVAGLMDEGVGEVARALGAGGGACRIAQRDKRQEVAREIHRRWTVK